MTVLFVMIGKQASKGGLLISQKTNEVGKCSHVIYKSVILYIIYSIYKCLL